jgi:hypothetical protein
VIQRRRVEPLAERQRQGEAELSKRRLEHVGGWPPFVDMRCGTIWRPGGLVVATGLCERTCSASYRQWTTDG